EAAGPSWHSSAVIVREHIEQQAARIAELEALHNRMDEEIRAKDQRLFALEQQREPLRYTADGKLAECPCCGSLDVGGAHDTVNCYVCGLTVTKPAPLQNAHDAWNTRSG